VFFVFFVGNLRPLPKPNSLGVNKSARYNPPMKIPSFKKLLLNLHLYLGLLSFPYLIIFGISSLNFNHPFEFTRAESAPTTWQEPINVPNLPRLAKEMSGDEKTATKAKANHQVREALGLFGNQRPWNESKWKDETTYHASLIRPGRRYEVDVDLKTNTATVNEFRPSIFSVIKGLHGFHGTMPGSAFISTWTFYTELATLTVLFAGISGIILWTRRPRERKVGLIMLASTALFSIALMIYITL
jgi:hypothetical protein